MLVYYLILVLTFISILWYIHWRVSRKHLLELASRIPGPKGYPLLGNTLDFFGSAPDIFKALCSYASGGQNVAKVWIGPRLMVFLYNPRDIEIILSSHVHIDKSIEYNAFRPWLGEAGLLISTGEKWKSHRKLIAPAFHLSILKTFVDLFNANSRELVAKLRKEVGNTFDCHEYFGEATAEILLETVMGVSKKTQDQASYDYALAVIGMCDILHMRHFKLWLAPDFLFKLSSLYELQKRLLNTIHCFTKKVIENKIKIFESPPATLQVDDVGEKRRLAFLDIMIEASQNEGAITEEEIQQQVDTIMFEGHDTTASASSFFLSMLGIHQDVQDEVLREVDKIFGGSDRPATFADTLEMKYLERCLMETLRLYPPVPIIARELKEDVQIASENYVLPAGCTLIVGTYQMHRRGDIYPNPDKFDPDNFLPERTVNRDYYAFIPFSAGPRSCVGRKYAMLKLKILLSTILRNFRIESDLKESDFRLQGDIILKRAEGFNIRLVPRKACSY